MSFEMPKYHHPDFKEERFVNAPDAAYEKAEKDGVAPENYHSTSMYPEYFKINGQWILAEESRMDSCVILRENGKLDVVEARNIKKGDRVILGRTEKCEDGIYMHCNGFIDEEDALEDQFVFRQGRSRETSYARDYDKLFELLKHEKEYGNIVWVMGPAFAFDADARRAMKLLIENGYAHGIMAGNALATHDLEGALLHTIWKVHCYILRWDRIFIHRDLSQTVIIIIWTSAIKYAEAVLSRSLSRITIWTMALSAAV